VSRARENVVPLNRIVEHPWRAIPSGHRLEAVRVDACEGIWWGRGLVRKRMGPGGRAP
jgi:hypothetical protein